MSIDPSIVEIFTDGGCSPNPGAGGWAALLRSGAHEKTISGFTPDTTNNRMELQAAIEALRALKKPSIVRLTTDSRYVEQGMQSWLANWKRRGWRTASGGAVSNLDLWQELDRLCQIHQVQFAWVRGHNGHAENELVDQLVREARERGAAALPK
jgi:ribonuclease HI